MGVSLRAIRLALLGAALLLLLATGAARARAACNVAGSSCQVTVTASELGGSPAITNFNFIVNVDNSEHIDGLTGPDHPFPQSQETQSYSPLIAEGDSNHHTVTVPVPSSGRQQYLISMRSFGHKLWGAYFTLPASSATVSIPVELTKADDTHPLPLGKIRVFVFNDNTWTNGAPDTEEDGLKGFQVGLDEQTGSTVSVDFNNNPLCSKPTPGDFPPGSWPGCKTDSDGFMQIDDLGPATYFIDVQPPVHADGTNVACNSHAHSRWFQTTTIDGGVQLVASTEEGADGTGAPGEQLWEPADKRTAYWFGFVCAPQEFGDPGHVPGYNTLPAAQKSGDIAFDPRNWQGWPPYDVLTLGDRVDNPIVALSDNATDRTVYVHRFTEADRKSDGNFHITGVPAGQYNLAVWDEQLNYIIRFTTVVLTNGQHIDANDVKDANGTTGLGVSRWFGWLDGHVYKDSGVTETGQMIPGGKGNGLRDCLPPLGSPAGTAATDCEPAMVDTDMDQRWRDGSIKEATFTNPEGYYEYPTAEGGALGKWFINEQGFARFSAFTGASVHNELQPNGRTDPPSGATNVSVSGGSATVLDPWAKTIDVTYPVTGTGIPLGTLIKSLNTASTTLAAAITDTATTATIASAAGFPANAPYPVRIGNEIVRVTGRAGTTLTLAGRGNQGVPHALGASVVVVQGFTMDQAATGNGSSITVGAATHVPTDQGGALLTNQLVTEGHRATVDWGKQDYLNQVDAATYTAGSATVSDTATTDEYAGHSVSGVGIPAGTTMGDVNPGVGFTLKTYDGSANVNATQSGTSVSVNETGQIVGITYFATTRNEFDAFKAAHEDYEAAIPDATVYLETPGPDGVPNTADDKVVNAYVTDHWQQPNANQDPLDATLTSWTQGCTVTDYAGYDISGQLNGAIGPNCLETPISNQQTKDGAFDGGYAFDSYCPNGINLSGVQADGSWNPNVDVTCVGGGDPSPDAHPLVSGNYITHAIMPSDSTDSRSCNAHTDPGAPAGDPNVTSAKGQVPGNTTGCLFRVEKEEDVNVDLGEPLATPQIPPPPCVGDPHAIDQSTLTPRSKFSVAYDGAYNLSSEHPPLCDKHIVELKDAQNANSDFNLIANQPTDPNGVDPTDTHTGDVEEPGRIIGLVSNDIYFENDPNSMWYGEPRPIGGIPVGIYQRVDTTGPEPNANLPYTPDKWRLFTTVWTSPEGTYEAVLPSTETFNCPIPQGPCPGMYLFTVNDPGSAENPNHGYNPNILTATSVYDVWPGLTDQLDTPLDPISGTGCEDPAAPARPELLEVSSPVVPSSGSRQVTIKGDFIGAAGTNTSATGPHVNLTDFRTGTTTTLSFDNGGIASWKEGTSGTTGVPDQIVINVPALSPAFPAGQKQLQIVTSAANGGVSSTSGITMHVLGGPLAAINNENVTLTPRRFALLATANPGDLGFTVTGTSIPTVPATTITQVAPGLGFLASAPRSSVGSSNVTISRANPGSIANGSTVVADTAAVASDLGRRANISGGGGMTGNRTITAVNPGVSITVSGSNATQTGARTVTVTKLPTPQSANFVNRFVADPAATSAFLGATVAGTGIPAGATIVAVFPGVGFVLSASYTQNAITAEPVTIGGSVAAYNPPVVDVYAPDTASDQDHRVQNAIDAATAGTLIVLHPNAAYTNGTFNENVLVWKPVKLQGSGPGGIVGAHELQARDPEDPRFHVLGTTIDGRYFRQHADDFNTTVSAHGPYAGVTAQAPVLTGADVTVVAKATTSFDNPGGVTDDNRIDGLSLTTGDGQGVGGIQLQEYANNTQLTNNVLENNGGVFGGGIGLGQPWVYQLTGGTDPSNHNYNVAIENDQILGNGGLTLSGGIAAFYGSNNYDIGGSVICSNFGVEYGAGISHYGYSPGGKIHDNQIYYNEAVDSGAGIAVQTELPPASSSVTPPYDPIIGQGTGQVDIDRNLIQSNYSADDGGGIFTLDAQLDPINVRNNMIVDNGASDKGGALLLDDSSNVRIVNNTISNNVTTDSCETCLVNTPQGAGLVSEANDPAWQGSAAYASQYPIAASRPDFSNPTALFNNIFWDNDAYTLDQKGPGATLNDAGFIDFGVATPSAANSERFTPRFSDMTNGLVLHGTGTQTAVAAGQGNRPVGTDPGFVTPFTLELTVSGSRLDPQVAAVSITGADPPVGLTGDYHITAASPMIDRGAHCSNTSGIIPALQAAGCSAGTISAPSGAVNADYDGGARPILRTFRLSTPWDIGADEITGGTLIPVVAHALARQPTVTVHRSTHRRHHHHHHHHPRHGRHTRHSR